jgi:hypothetical protein
MIWVHYLLRRTKCAPAEYSQQLYRYNAIARGLDAKIIKYRLILKISYSPYALGLVRKSNMKLRPASYVANVIACQAFRPFATHKHQVAIPLFAQDKPGAHQVEIVPGDRHDLAVNNDSERR